MELSRTTPSSRPPLRNPGPDWGYDFLKRLDRTLPDFLVQPLLGFGAACALILMPRQRRHSHAYLSTILRRPARLREVWRHFHTYSRVLMMRIHAAETGHHRCLPQPSFESFRALMCTDRPALLGTIHFGNSDLLGFLLGEFRRHVHMIRLRLGNSRDTRRLSDRFGRWVTYVWVNETENLLFALKDAAQSGGSIAMMCDRIEHSSKVEPFEFLGARRLMPFTIYHLSIVFHLPVVFCLSVPGAKNESLLHASPIFEPDGPSREENLARARAHFQAFLRQLESLLRANPYLWFNFLPLSPALADPASTSSSATTASPHLVS